MASIEKSVDVDLPVRTVYNQWTQFEEFPLFMEGVKEVQQLDDKHLHWRAEVLGKETEWTAEITEQVPDQRISWRSTSGARNVGTVSFTPLGPSQTKVTARIEYDPEGASENAASALGLVSARIEGDLKRFRKFIEQRGKETGQWRSEIQGSKVLRSPGGDGE